MRRWRCSLLMMAALAAFSATAAGAEDVAAVVGAGSYPWNRSLNPQMPFGLGDGKAPKIVRAGWPLAGLRIRFKAQGQTFIQAEFPRVDPDGLFEVTEAFVREARLPVDYTSNGRGGMHLGALLGAFVDADGKVVGNPFVIGRLYEAKAPDRAVAVSLGINDDRYRDNEGEYAVIVTIPRPEVTVEPAQP